MMPFMLDTKKIFNIMKSYIINEIYSSMHDDYRQKCSKTDLLISLNRPSSLFEIKINCYSDDKKIISVFIPYDYKSP